jgi:hypothetical protein
LRVFACTVILLQAGRSLRLPAAVKGRELPEHSEKGISALFIRVRNRFYFRNGVRLSAEPFLLMKMEKQYVFMLLSGIINYTG